jgi:hypothetical protein
MQIESFFHVQQNNRQFMKKCKCTISQILLLVYSDGDLCHCEFTIPIYFTSQSQYDLFLLRNWTKFCHVMVLRRHRIEHDVLNAIDYVQQYSIAVLGICSVLLTFGAASFQNELHQDSRLR